MDLFSFIRHSDPIKVLIREKEVAAEEVKLLTLTEGHVVPLVPPASTASGGSNDSIDKMFDEGNDVRQDHSIKRDDDAPTETITKDVSEVVVEKTKKFKRKRKTAGDASGRVRKLSPNTESVALSFLQSDVGVTKATTKGSVTPLGTPKPSEINPRMVARDFPLILEVPARRVRKLSPNTESVAPSFLFPVADAPVMTVAVTTTVVADVSAVPAPKVRVESKNLEIFGDSASVCGANANVASTSKLNEPATILDSFYASHDLDSETLHRIYVPKWKLYAEFNVGAARQMYLGAKVRMRAKHAMETRGVFDRAFRGVKDEEVVVEEGVVVTYSSLEMLTNIFDRAFRGVKDEEVVVEEGVVVTSSSLEMLTNSCLEGIMVSLIFLEELEEEALVEFMVELFEKDDKKSKKYGLLN
nr:hypothetical protein [Tanacetum cinerariifolium]